MQRLDEPVVAIESVIREYERQGQKAIQIFAEAHEEDVENLKKATQMRKSELKKEISEVNQSVMEAMNQVHKRRPRSFAQQQKKQSSELLNMIDNAIQRLAGQEEVED